METEKKPIQFKKLYNNTPVDFTFFWDSAPYTVKAGESREFIDYIAEHGARKLADKFSKTNDKEEKKVMAMAFMENLPEDVVAKRLGVDLNKIRKEALNKEKETARVVNLESQVADLTKKLNSVLEAKETKEEIKETKEEVKVDKRKKEYKEAQKAKEADEQ